MRPPDRSLWLLMRTPTNSTRTLMMAFLAASAALHSSTQLDCTPSRPARPACGLQWLQQACLTAMECFKWQNTTCNATCRQL